jgi:hypothetical protein
MRSFLAFISILVAGFAIAGPSGDFAKSGRILTIEQWGYPEGMAWAVLDRRIIVYRMSDIVNSKDQIVVVKPITAEQSQAIKEAIKNLPADALGFRFDALLSTDAPMLRLGFHDDGSLDSKGIEASGLFPSWMEKVVTLVSGISKTEAPITFAETIRDYRKRHIYEGYVPPIRKSDLRTFYDLPSN